MPEFEARTVKEAIALGLDALGISQEDAVIEIVDEGRSGVFGMGTKEAVVRITPKSELTEERVEETVVEDQPEPAEETVEKEETVLNEDDLPETEPKAVETAAAEAEMPVMDSEDEHVLAISADFLQGMLDRMGLQAGVTAQLVEGEDEIVYRLNITGDDLGILIGRRAETLDALQYLTRLVVNQQTHRWYRIEVDVENYKQRREQSLQRLAQTMADQAVKEHRTMVMEPMPARERRLIHLALRDRDDVHTESIGEGDARKVTIVPN